METEMGSTIKATDIKAQYDASAKRLLSHKSILARILIKTVAEFQDMKPEEVIPLIEGTPYISRVPEESGLTNTLKKSQGERIVGLNTENAEINEGLVRFDIVFYVRMSDGISQIIINIELQKDEPTEYEILNRAVFYVSRLISSQKERDFENMHYDDTYELHRLLGTLLSDSLDIKEKLDIIGEEYRIPVEKDIREDVNVMCNLSRGIEERGIEKGIEKGELKGKVEIYFKEMGLSLETISEKLNIAVEEVQAIIDEKKLSVSK